MKSWILFLIIFVSFGFGGILLANIILKLFMKLAKKTKTELDDKIVKAIKAPLNIGILIVAAYITIYIVKIPANYLKIIDKSLFVLTVILIALATTRVFDVILTWLRDKAENKEFANKIVPLVQKGIKIFVWIAALMIVFKRFNYDISSLIVSLGVGSLALGLAAQDTLANMFAGFTILLDQPFKIGDRIKLESGEFGDVIEIGLRSTKIRTVENNVLIIPNSTLVKSKVLNFYMLESRVIVKIPIGVAYGSNPQIVRKALEEAALSVEEVLKDPPPRAFFTEYADFSLNFLLVFSVRDPRQAFATKDKVNEIIGEKFAEYGIEIPFPIQTIYLKKEEKDESEN